MADRNISQLTNINGVDIASADEFPVFDASDSTTKAVTKTELDKSIGTVLDNTFAIADNSDNTKKIAFQASGITTATTRTVTIPDANLTVLGTDTVQTITNKTIDPSLNTVNGDKLDITFTPSNYTPTTTGVAEASDVDDLAAHLKGIDNSFGVITTREYFFTPAPATDGTVGTFPIRNLNSSATTYFSFKVPTGTTAISKAVIVVIPDATETIQWDIATNFGASGELYTANTDSELNDTQAVTVNVLTELDVMDSLTGVSADDYVGLSFTSDTSTIRVVGLLLKFTVTS